MCPYPAVVYSSLLTALTNSKTYTALLRVTNALRITRPIVAEQAKAPYLYTIRPSRADLAPGKLTTLVTRTLVYMDVLYDP